MKARPVEFNEHTKSSYFYIGKKYWSVTDLWKAADKIKPVKVPLQGINISEERALANSVYELVDEMKRVLRADLSYPILLTPEGEICDGVHRLSKALLKDKKYIMVKRFTVMPDGSTDE